jgi:putative oxidoreductase
MSVQNSAAAPNERRGFVQQVAGMVRPGPALGYDLVRAYLGIGLFVRGVLFVSQPELVLGYLQDIGSWFLPYALVHFVAVAHLCGGVMLGIGLATRLAAALQVPILAGAVFLVHSQSGLLNVGQSLEFSGLVLALLLVYLTFGSGRLSVDAFLARSEVRALEVQTPSLIPERPLRGQVVLARANTPQKYS